MRSAAHPARRIVPFDRERKPIAVRIGRDHAIRHSRHAVGELLGSDPGVRYVLLTGDQHSENHELDPVDHDRGEDNREHIVAHHAHGVSPSGAALEAAKRAG